MIPSATETPEVKNGEPRTRGDDPECVEQYWVIDNVSPAPAGMIPESVSGASQVRCEPRTRGDDPTLVYDNAGNPS